ncbi:MAG TPA: alkaline phosphatase family protein [Thermoplasmata archaeon]|nr:alkaline phosphatase family protein [Thermoplasmata archaeon]
MATKTDSTPPTGVSLALIVLDGLGDRPHPATGNRSPVESAATPNLDRLTSHGQIGEVIVVGPGVAPESDAGVFALLGYDPIHDSPGRGVLEALGVEIPLAPGDVALRLNFATVDGDGTVLDSRVGRTLGTSEATDLARGVSAADLLGPEGIRAEVRATVGHRGVLWLHPESGGPLSSEVSNADPFYEKVGGMGQARRPEIPKILEVKPTDASPEAARTARALNLFLDRSRVVLAGERVNARRAMGGKKIANGLLVRNAGTLLSSPPQSFEARYGVRGAAVTEMPVERGIARVLGLADHYVGPMGANRDSGYRERARITSDLLTRTPFVYVHLKGPDEPGHDGDAPLKQEIVEAIDRSFFGPFLQSIDLSGARIAVTADHATPCILKGHSDDPVPFLLTGAGVAETSSPGVRKFGETSAAHGSLGTRTGAEVLRLLFHPPATTP